MGSLFDYLDWRGDLSFEQVGLCEIDNLILSMISYVDFDGIVPQKLSEDSPNLLTTARQYVRRHRGQAPHVGLIVPPDVVSITAKAAKTRRFGSIRLSGYVNHISDNREMQFSAITFSLGNSKHYIAYRGTDDTLIGWKENFNMSFMDTVPAQLEAMNYLNHVANDLHGDLFVGGHSKGGNLAVYAAVKCDAALKTRILTVYNNDGPGFKSGFMKSNEYLNMRGKIRTIVPQSSVVGMLLDHEENYEVVKSNQVGLLQHNGFSWEVLGASFIHLDTVTNESKFIDRTLKKWLSELGREEREAFVDSLFETFSSTNAKTLTDLNADKVALVKAWSKLPPESRTIIRKCIALLIKNGAKSRKEE